MSRHATARMINRTEPILPFVVAALALSLSVFLMLIWPSQTQMPSLVRAPGQLGPLNDLAQIDHFDGGVVEELYVEPGQPVSKGDLIAVVRQPTLPDEMRRVAQELAALRLDTLRIETVLRNLDDPRDIAQERPPAASEQTSVLAAYVASQDVAYRARRASLTARLSQLARRLETTEAVRTVIEERLLFAEAQFQDSATLFEDGLIGAAAHDQRRTQWQSAREDLYDVALQIIEIDSSQTALHAEMTESEAVWREDLRARLFALSTEIETLETELVALKNRTARAQVHSPRDGTIQAVVAGSVGHVVPPGGTIVTMLDAEDQLVVLAKLDPRDIGHVAPGAAVRVRVTTYDFREFGDVGGVVASIAPTSEVDENQVPHFHMVVALDQPFLGTGNRRRLLSAGMEVSVEVQTDDRSLLTYFFKPAQRVIDRAMAER